MPIFLNWLLRLIPTNPICMRLIQGGSRRMRHLYLRAGYLGIMIIVLLFAMLSNIQGTLGVRDLATAGAQTFQLVSYLQVGLICLLTPVFMAGAIAQEANPRTWDILLTTPLNSLQVVLGNLFGRLFFILALLFSSLPLFAVTQYFGGVPGTSIFASYAIAGAMALLVATVAITLSVTRTAGKRAVFLFYTAVVLYLFITFAVDQVITPRGGVRYTTIMTPLNPFLVLEVLLASNVYQPHDYTGQSIGWLKHMWMARPIAAFSWLCVGISTFLILFSTFRLRVIGASVGNNPWYRRLLRLGAKGTGERPGRRVSHNPVAWRERMRGKAAAAVIGRWGFVVLGVATALILTLLHRSGVLTPGTLQTAVLAVVSAEIVIIALTAINMSATAVSREREDGTLDLILVTPIQPGPYLSGKLRGLVQFLIPMMLVPSLTLLVLAIYVMTGGYGGELPVLMDVTPSSSTSVIQNVPIVMPIGAFALPLMLVPFIAFCVMVGLHWSIKSQGTTGSVVAAVMLVIVVAGVAGLCGLVAGKTLAVVGAVLDSFSPINLVWSIVNPATMIPDTLEQGLTAASVSLLIGSALAGVVYSVVVVGLHTNMKRSFMMTVRRLAGAN